MNRIAVIIGAVISSAFLSTTTLEAQTYSMQATSGTGPLITTCGGTILDPGGAGAYDNSLDVYQTICPTNPGESISLTFVSFGTESCCDELTIYEGPDNTGAQLGIWAGSVSPGVVTSSEAGNGCLTLYFNSDGSVTGSGFEATMECVPSPPAVTLGTGGATITGCSGVITDPGGAGNYGANENVVQTFCSGTGECVKLDFQLMATETGVDLLNVYDGPSTADALISTYSGTIAAPDPVQSSTVSSGCLTLEFISNGSNEQAGFRASITCVPCEIPPVVLGQGGTITGCSGTILDPGGNGNYPNNASITQTFCSGTNECVRIQFSEFATEATVDRLRIYDGPNTNGNILGIYSGTPFNPPAPVQSSTASGGCMTLEFTSNASFNNTGFVASISCVPCEDPVVIPTGFCDDALPFCSDVGQTFPAATNTQSEFGSGINCLGSTPNPAWYFLRIEDSGDLDMQITANSDIDFICWGPFTEIEWQNGVCNTILDPVWAADNANVIDCSYSATNNEDFDIIGAISGEYYVVLITNYSNQSQNISFTQDGGAGSTDCSILCQTQVQGGPTVCDPATNTYSVTGTVTLTNPPTTGTLLIENSTAGYDVYNAPFPASIPFDFGNISSDGAMGSVTVSFSDDGTCVTNLNYTAPETCSSCPVTAGVSGPACEGQDVSLTATDVDNGQYSWTGPNGFTSNLQNPVLTNVTPAMAGVYTVTALNPMNACSSISSINVFVFPTPATPTISNDSPVCEGTALNLTCDPVAGATYDWTGPNAFASNLQNPTIASALITAAGTYECRVIVNTCPSLPATTDVVINAYPTTPVPTYNGPLCQGDNLMLDVPAVAGAIYEWTSPAGAVMSAQQSPQLTNVSPAQSGTYGVRVQVNGCWSLIGTVDVAIFPTPATPAPVSNSPVCQFDEITITGPAPLPVVGTIYAWTGPNLFSATTQNVSILNAQQVHAGTYTLIITENGCESAPGSVDVAITDIPISNAGADITVCSNEDAPIGAPAVPGYSYSWSPIEGLDFANISNPTVSISNFSGTPRVDQYIVTTTELGCSSKDTVVVTINPQPVCSFVGPDPQCFEGNSFDFEANGNYSGSANFYWDFGPWATPDSSFDANPQDVSFNSTGLQIVSLRVEDLGCFSNPYQAPVMVYKMPVANFVSDTLVGCDPMVVNFTNLSEGSPDNGIKTIEWEFGNGRSSTAQNPSILFNDPGQFDVSLTVTNERGCVSVYLIREMVTVNPSPVADFSMDPEVVYIVKPEIMFEDLSTGGDEVYYSIHGLDSIFQNDFLYEFPDSGHYKVTQFVNTALGCSDSLTRVAIVELGYKLYVPSAFTPNYDGYNDFFRAYGEDVKDFEMQIFNRGGELMYTSYDIENGWDGTTRLTNKVAPGGVYVYKIKARQKNGLKNDYEGTVVLLR
ncbi:MAG: CUB domain-containing protein [Bacteroidia bacterium]